MNLLGNQSGRDVSGVGAAMRPVRARATPLAGALIALATLSGCTAADMAGEVDETTTGSISAAAAHPHSEKERECLERAIFFESNRSSEDGLVAVGTVVMNRVQSGKFPETVCGVVGQKNQFAPGVLSRPLPRDKVPDVQEAAAKVLAGHRHPELGPEVMFFHQAGLTFPYKNMHYKIVAGGNAFYEKR